MGINNMKKTGGLGLALSLTLAIGVGTAMAQDKTDTTTNSTTSQIRNVTNGEKVKIQGTVVKKDGDQLLVRDLNGTEMYVRLTDNTSVKTKGGFFRNGKRFTSNSIVRGLSLEVEGRGDTAGQVVAEKVRFTGDDLRVAQSIESRVNPVEDRLSQSEENAKRLSGQIDELIAISNVARGGAKNAQETADLAVDGVNRTNTRINSLDDYDVKSQATVNFRVNSALLSPEAKANLDTIAQNAMSSKGYVIEVTGFADSTGNAQKNRVLSQKRAEAVIQYLVENHGIPLRRILPTYGYGENQSIADNATREGRAQNRRVEVKILVSKGMTEDVKLTNPTLTNQDQ
jgi:outer membrane protein OmpA-like peptidoglycan-associated protein